MSPASLERLLWVPLGQLHAHPRNANLMSPAFRERLEANLRREERYPPVIVRPHPAIAGEYQLLDGHQRVEALRRLGHEQVLCFPWPCDDATALVLLATLNRLEGEDVPARRAELLAELSALLPAEELALLLPEDGRQLEETLSLLNVDVNSLMAELEAAAERQGGRGPRLISFAVDPGGEAIVEQAVARAMAAMSGQNRRGQAIVAICSAYLVEGQNNG